MRYKKVGNSSLKVSVFSLGSNNFGAQVSEQDTIRLIGRAIDLGINSIDTADIYTDGKSEEIIGKAVKGRRNDVVIASKVGLIAGASRKSVLKAVNDSLRRMKTDYVDMYYVHAFDHATPLEETMSTLNEFVREGKIRNVACSNFSGPQMEMARAVCEKNGYAQFIADQPEYNVLQRKAEVDVIPYCEKENLGVFPYSPLMGGVLVGKYTKDRPAPKGSRGAYNQKFFKSVGDATYEKVEELRSIADGAGISLMELSLGWLLKRKAVTSVVVGASRPDQLQATADIADRNLSSAVVKKVDSLTAA